MTNDEKDYIKKTISFTIFGFTAEIYVKISRVFAIVLFGTIFGSIAVGFITKSLMCAIMFAVASAAYYACLKYFR